MKNILILIIAIAFAGCVKKKSSVELWHDNNGNEVPVTVTEKVDTTAYDFGVIVMSAGTTTEVVPNNDNPCDVNYLHKLGLDTVHGSWGWEYFTSRLGEYYGSSSMSIRGLDETNWTFESVCLMFEGDSIETWRTMCEAERLFGH
jgi:hypothetical protein